MIQRPEPVAEGPAGVLVCYAPADHERVGHLAQALAEYALVPWVDMLEIHPGDRLPLRLGGRVDRASACVLAVVSENSASASWLQELNHDKSAGYGNSRYRIVPCLLGQLEPPAILGEFVRCDLSADPVTGIAEVLRVVHQDRHVLRIPLDAADGLQLDPATLRSQLARIFALSSGFARICFVVDAVAVLSEIQDQWRATPVPGAEDPLSPRAAGCVRRRAAVPLFIPNLSCILAKVSDTTLEYVGRESQLIDVLVSVAQKTTALSLYWFWRAVGLASAHGLIEGLRSCDGPAVAAKMARIDRTRDPNRFPARSIEAYLFDCKVDDLLDLELIGRGKVLDSRVNVPAEALLGNPWSMKNGGSIFPEKDVLEHQWLRFFVPAIAGRQVIESSFAGQCIGRGLDCIGLLMASYRHLGIA